MTKKILFIVAITVSATFGVFAQTPTPTPTPQIETTITTGGQQQLPLINRDIPTMLNPTLETILAEAEKQTINYRDEFRNLLAVETKTYEKYDKTGAAKDQSVIESNFFVYQSSKDENVSSELRNVLKADGKAVPDSQARADRLTAELQKTSTVESELKKIQDEGSRYDKSLRISGFTLFEGIALADNLRPFFDFKLFGKENYEGGEVYVVEFRQTKKSPFITVNAKESKSKGIRANFDVSLPGSLKKSDVFMNGKLWIDAKTFQIRREERNLVVQAASPITAMQTVLEYQPSDYGVFVPKRISLTQYSIKKNKDNNFSNVKDMQVSFDYSKFRKTEVDVKILDDDQ